MQSERKTCEKQLYKPIKNYHPYHIKTAVQMFRSCTAVWRIQYPYTVCVVLPQAVGGSYLKLVFFDGLLTF